MSALHTTRRRVLAAAATGLAGALGGCSGESSRTPRDTPRDPRDGPPPGATTEFEVRTLSADVEEPFVGVDTEQNRSGGHRGYLFVLDDAEAERLRFDAAVDGTGAIRSFVEATDFERETVVVVQQPIGECYERITEYVELADDRFRVQFCRILTDATVPCEAGSDVMTASFLRVPRAYEDRPSRIGSGGRSSGSGGRSRCPSDDWGDEG